MRIYLNYINGKFIPAKSTVGIINPAAGSVFAQAALADSADIENALSAARLSFDKGLWRNFSLSQRKEFLLKIAEGISNNAQELIELETLNNGKPIKESTFMDIPGAIGVFEHFADNLEKYLIGEVINVQNSMTNALTHLTRRPRGVCVLIVPFNYPLLIACWKLASALAAGNTVILKPSNLTPLSVLELAKIIDRCGLPAGVINIINVPGEIAGPLLCADKRVDMISFTGSNEVGKKIAQYAAVDIKKITLELGGKSAAIICGDVELETAVNGTLASIFLNQGQMCTAMSRILVDRKIYDNFLDDFAAKTKKLKIGNGIDFETQVGPLISRDRQKNVLDCIHRAKEQGAKIVCGGNFLDCPGFFVEPAILTEVTSEMDIFQQEVFGPVVCISPFDTIEQAVESVNDSQFGLAASIWSKDLMKAKEIAGYLQVGTVWINTYGMFFPELPYGGFKQSGYGKELGKEGFYEYTCLQNVVIDQPKSENPMISYWYGF